MSRKNTMMKELWNHALFNEGAYELLDSIAKDGLTPENEKKLMLELTTVRNRNLITAFEQRKLSSTVVAFFGLSVGSHACLTWIMESRATEVKIVDPDTVSPSNLNRLRFGWDDVGKKKVDVVEVQLKSIQPNIRVYKGTGTSPTFAKEVITSKTLVNCIVEAIDDIEGKLNLRMIAKEYKIPLIMATDVGDNVFLDIERYDIDPDVEPFLGRVPDIYKKNLNDLQLNEKVRIALEIVGLDFNSEEMLTSILDIGDKLATWPQLGATATIAGGTVATAIKKIVLGEKVLSGRYVISLDNLLVSNFDNKSNKRKRESLAQLIHKKYKKS